MALAPLVLSTVGPATSGAATIGGAPSDVVSSLAGHWRCTDSNGSVFSRSYVVTDGAPVMTGTATAAGQRAVGGVRSSVDTPGAGTASVLRTVYGRREGSDTGPAFERLVERADRSLSVETPEGVGTAASSEASALRFTGQQSMGRADTHAEESGLRAPASLTASVRPLSLSYAVGSGAMHRTARTGSTTLSEESCTRERDVASSGACTNANAPATTVHAVIPRAPAGAPQQGTVQMRLVIDDRGQVIGEDILSSPSPALTRAALGAARDSTFTAAVQNCRAVFSQHVFAVQFTPDAQRAPSNNGRETNL